MFDTVQANDSEFFVDTDEFGEAITLTPVGKAARSISAVVERYEFTIDGAMFTEIYVTVRNSATAGITPVEYAAGQCTVSVAKDKGGTAVTMTAVGRPTDQDAGCVRFRVA